MEEQSKFKYLIFPDQVYILEWDDLKVEVTGQEILAQFRRESYLEHLIKSIDEQNNQDSIDL